MLTLSGTAQDLIARQAPADRHMKNLNHVKIEHTLTVPSVDLNNPASDIYTNWVHNNLRNSTGYLAANSRIDLRRFAMPTTSRKVTSKFGRRWGRNHEGLDIKVYVGDTIRAAFDGKVRISSYNAGGYGYYIVIRHPNGLETLYGHMSKLLANEDQIVTAGQPIGLGGNTGRSFGAHLHFETRICGTPINPAEMFDFEHQDVVSDFYTTRKTYGKDRAGLSGSAVASTTNRMQNEADRETETASIRDISRDSQEDAAATEPENGQSEGASATTAPAPTRTVATKARTRTSRARAKTYTVKNGDTLYDIARKHGMTVKQLCQRNGISQKRTLIHKGQKLKI